MTELVPPLDTKIHDGGRKNTRLLSKYDVELFLKQNVEFTKQMVLQYLQNNLAFTEEYFIATATMELFQKWYDQKINLRLNRGSSNQQRVFKHNSTSKSAFAPNFDDSSSVFLNDDQQIGIKSDVKYNNIVLPNMANVCQYIDLSGNPAANRRRSEPGNSNDAKKMVSSSSEEFLDTIDENTPVRTVRSNSVASSTQLRYRTISLDENNNNMQNNRTSSDDVLSLLPSEQSNGKPFLRKAQSAPTYKKNLSQLIRSSVYSGTGNHKHINIENHMELRESSETNFLVEIIKDISKDLSLTQTCFKILTNLGFMLNVEKASIYIVQTINGRDFLNLYLSEVSIADGLRKESFSDAIDNSNAAHVPIGKGIIGHVALMGSSLIANDVEQLNEYEPTFDEWYNDSVYNALLHPIVNNNHETIAVIVTMNNKNGDFVEEDKQIGSTFLSYCSIAVMNSLIFELTKEEFDRNKTLLEFSHDIFEDQLPLTNCIEKILNKSIEMFACKRASLMLLDDPKEIDDKRVFSKLFQVTAADNKTEKRFSKFQRDSMVFSSNFDPFSDVVADTNTLKCKMQKKMILSATPVNSISSGILYEDGVISIPIRNNVTQIIGVLKLLQGENNSSLSGNEEQLLEAFAIFAGLSINNCIMYENIVKGQAHQKVALEALSYHTAARQTDVDKLKFAVIPSCSSYNLTSLTFDDFSLLDHEMLTSAIRMFMEFGFLQKYQIEYEVLCRFLITVKNNYRRVIYHNWRHAFNVTQSMFAVLTTGKMSEQFSSTECLALLVGCICHDLDHRGTNNEFQMKTDSPLVKLYGTSTMEQHHFNCAVTILNSEGNNIFAQLQSQDYRSVMKLLKHAILATDLSNYLRQREKFSSAVSNKTLDTGIPENRALIRSMLMTACDLSGITKPWNIQKRVVHLVTSEFFHQGDIERNKLHVEPKEIMDRKHILQLPKLQVSFFEFMGIPVYSVLADYNVNLKPFLDGAKNNKSRWLQMSRKIEQGHVDPDIEPVLHPVTQEEF